MSSNLSVTCGDKTFSDFSISNFAGDVTVTSFDLGGNAIGVSFNAGWSAVNQSIDMTLRFKVTVNDPNWFVTSIGQSMTAGANTGNYVAIDEFIWSGQWESGENLAKSFLTTGLLGEDVIDPQPEAYQGDSLVLLTPSQSFWVTKDIHLFALAEVCPQELTTCVPGQARATTITQTFFQTPGGDIPDVPEPATMLLFSTALLGLGFMRRKKS